MKWRLYRLVMKVAHKYNWHYAPPVYPDGDKMLWCQWCGFRQVITKSRKFSETNTVQTSAECSASTGE
jgi:hypothetical protein